ncbi:ankyrin repeat domain-containing protein 33B [Trichomycterus rosablanca]|uniref:ankyrin repeat domain-containing protein 33B n=1 Tax=Trichomycterus rosablanca TaxID=2290929 RepID=UPI002F355CF9
MAAGESSIQKSTDLEEKENSDPSNNGVYCENGGDDDQYDDDDDDDDVYQEFEEFDFSQLPDTKSIASDDSFYPPDQRSPTPEDQEPLTFFMACCSNNAIIVKIMIRQGVTEEEVREVDKNNRTGLIMACYQGDVNVVIALSQCPYIDINWQDNEGNTAVMAAAQAGHIMITNYLLNYYAGLDLELRNCHGFTAIMKAALQGRIDCVRALMMSGADIEARDYGRKLTPFEWALFTCHYGTARMMQQLVAQPCAEQFCNSFRMEWPMLQQLVGQAQKPLPCWRRLSEIICNTFTLRRRFKPQEEGVLDYMVRMTTALASPLVATACSTVCPDSPPCVGKRRPAVPDILKYDEQQPDKLKSLGHDRIEHYKYLFQNCHMPLPCTKQKWCASLQLPVLALTVVQESSLALRRSSLLPLYMMRRSSVCPGLLAPKVCLCKAPPPTYTPERNQCGSKNAQFLEVPGWRYKALNENTAKKEQNNKLKFPIMWRK